MVKNYLSLTYENAVNGYHIIKLTFSRSQNDNNKTIKIKELCYMQTL